MPTDDILRTLLMYFVLPAWLAAGFADYLCHRAAHIERTSGWKEFVPAPSAVRGNGAADPRCAISLAHTGIILLMIVCLLLHQATAMWDVSYAAATREVKPIEQHVHSVLEMMPLTGLLMVIALHWQAFIALLGLSPADLQICAKARTAALALRRR